MPKRTTIFLVTSVLYIIYTVFPLFSDVLSIPTWLPSLGSVFVFLLVYPKAFQNKMFLWFAVYAIVLIFFVMFHKPLTIGIGTVQDSRKIFIEFAYILPTISIVSILLYLNDRALTKRLIIISLAILIASFVVALPLLRQYASIRDALSEQGEELIVPGLPGYSLMHAYTLLVGGIMYLIKVTKMPKKLYAIAYLAVLCFMIYQTFVTTSLVVMVFILFFTFFSGSKTSPATLIGIMILSLVALLVFAVLGEYIIDAILPFFENSPVESKLIAIRQSLMNNTASSGGFMSTRTGLHLISWNSFFTNPLWGTSVVGGHSSLIDRFGGMGILGGVPYVMIFVSSIRKLLSYTQTRTARYYMIVGFMAGLIFLYEKGNWGCESWLFYLVLMPFTILAFESPDSIKARNN